MLGLKNLLMNKLSIAFMVVSAAMVIFAASAPANSASTTTLFIWITCALVLIGVWIAIAVEVVVVQRREMRYTHENGYTSYYMSALQQRKRRPQQDDLQLQAALSVQGLRQELPRGPSAKRLHRPKARGDTTCLPGKIQPARAFPDLWRLAQHRDELARKKFRALPELSQTLAEPDHDDPKSTTLELDELWSFVLRKERKRWVWLALCRSTRQVVAYFIGDRSEASCCRLWERVPEAYRGGYFYSDFWKAYQEVIPEERHEAVGKESGQTAHIERWNNTLRQRLSRFVKQSLSFSKSDRMHEICLRLFLHRYNLSISHD